jgi:hypothetical protein
MTKTVEPFFLSPREVVGWDMDPADEESCIKFYNQAGHWMQLVLYRAVRRALKQDPAMSGDIEDPVSLLTSWMLGFDRGGVEIAIHKGADGSVDGFLIVSLRVPLFTTRFSLNVERAWFATPEVETEMRTKLIEYVSFFNSMLPPERMPVQQIFMPHSYQENGYNLEIIKV